MIITKTDMEKICPRCATVFVCRVDNIRLCNCGKIILNDGVREYIKQHWGKCLCFDCLTNINQNIEQLIHNDAGSKEESFKSQSDNPILQKDS